jgi:hypothetical protein
MPAAPLLPAHPPGRAAAWAGPLRIILTFPPPAVLAGLAVRAAAVRLAVTPARPAVRPRSRPPGMVAIEL